MFNKNKRKFSRKQSTVKKQTSGNLPFSTPHRTFRQQSQMNKSNDWREIADEIADILGSW